MGALDDDAGVLAGAELAAAIGGVLHFTSIEPRNVGVTRVSAVLRDVRSVLAIAPSCPS